MAAPWSTPAPLARLVTILTALSGVQKVQVGVPETFDRQVTAYVTVAAQDVDNKASGGLMQRVLAYRVVLCYALDDHEETAEATLAAALDGLVDALFADRTLAGTLDRLEVNALDADEPVYVRVSGQEIRQYVLYVRGTQQKTYAV